MATTQDTLTDAGHTAVREMFAWAAKNDGKISRRGNSRRTIAYVPAEHVAFTRFSRNLKPMTAGKTATGIIIVEWLEPHQDSLSVSGIYLTPSDEMAPAHKVLWVAAGNDGTPDVDYLTRDGGALAKAMRHVW